MAKLIAPLLSFGARGRVGKDLHYQASPTGPRVIGPAPKTLPASPAQLVQRGLFRDASTSWRLTNNTPIQTAAWHLWSSLQPGNLTTWSHFLSDYLLHRIDGDPWPTMQILALITADIPPTAIASFMSDDPAMNNPEMLWSLEPGGKDLRVDYLPHPVGWSAIITGMPHGLSYVWSACRVNGDYLSRSGIFAVVVP